MIDDQIYQLLGSVEAAAVLAGVGIGPDVDPAGFVEDRLPLQEPLVDRAELLDGHVAVVDEAAPGARAPCMAQAVDDRGDLRESASRTLSSNAAASEANRPPL